MGLDTKHKIIFVYEFLGTALFFFCVNSAMANLVCIPLITTTVGFIAGPFTGSCLNPS